MRWQPTSPLPSLCVDGRPVATVEVASTGWARTRGLIGRPPPDGALWLAHTASVHTMAMGYAIDVACCDRTGVVATVHLLPPWRLLWPRPGIATVVEAAAGAFGRWGLHPSCHLSVAHPR